MSCCPVMQLCCQPGYLLAERQTEGICGKRPFKSNETADAQIEGICGKLSSCASRAGRTMCETDDWQTLKGICGKRSKLYSRGIGPAVSGYWHQKPVVSRGILIGLLYSSRFLVHEREREREREISFRFVYAGWSKSSTTVCEDCTYRLVFQFAFTFMYII